MSEAGAGADTVCRPSGRVRRCPCLGRLRSLPLPLRCEFMVVVVVVVILCVCADLPTCPYLPVLVRISAGSKDVRPYF